MPKLPADKAKEVENAESTGGLMEPGIYVMRLVSVDSEDGPRGVYWKWTFKVPEDTHEEHAKPYRNWNQWLNTSMSEKAAWKLKEVFDAFGVPTTTDTDDLVGRLVRVEVQQSTIQSGSRQGEMGNKVASVMPLDIPNGKAKASKKEEKPLY
jgi:hypothetical protein